MQAIVEAGHLPGTGATIAFDMGYPSMAPTPGNRALLTKLNGINRDLELSEMPALDPLKRGAGDIAFVAADTDGLVGLGLASSGDHSPAEKADLSTMKRQAKRAAILMSRLAGEKGRK
jgi:glutamate carboxypeptidase